MTKQQTWTRRVAAWRASGLTAAGFCEGRDFTPDNLWQWAHRLKKRAIRPAGSAGTAAVRFARVERVAHATRAACVVRPAAIAPPPPGALTIEWRDACLLVPAGFDAQTLDAVLGALSRHGRGGAR